MYDLIDRRVDALEQGSRFLLWSMRSWVASMTERLCPCQVLGPVFSKMGLLNALPDIHMAMSLLNQNALGQLSLSPVSEMHISESEALLLCIWRDMAWGRGAAARSTLELMVDSDSVGAIFVAIGASTSRLAAMDMSPFGLMADGAEAE